MTKLTDIPLVVDLDGTLTPTDTLVESLVKVVKQSLFNLLLLPFWLMRGRARLKANICSRINIAVELLPYRESLMDYLREEKSKGRRIVMATAAHHSIAEAVANHLGLFDQVLATEADCNLKGKAKLKAIQEKVGTSFVYAGDSKSDIPIWKEAHKAVLVNASSSIAAIVRQGVPIEREFQDDSINLSVWLHALRVHQWMKNLLLFVPLMTAFSFADINKITYMFVAFMAFSLAASATYIVNDLWDLESDRAHPRKRLRPFASGKLPILYGIAVASGTMLLAFILAFTVSTGFFWMLLFYLVLTSAYTCILKGYVLIDVVTLSLLYTLRILAGSMAVGITTSSWLLDFSVFMFMSLALVKRCAELVSLESRGVPATHGRDYLVTDLVVLWPLGVGAALSAVVVFGLFINAPETQSRYGTPQLLWLVAIGLIYWVVRLWVKTSRGEMHDDPVVYAIKDRGSRITVLIMIAVMLASHFLTLDFSL